MHEPTINELLADADALPERGGLGAALDAISRNVSDDAVSVTVNLHGKLVGLEFTEHAMQLPAAELAARISQATSEAAAAALADGMQALTDACGEHIAAAVAEHIPVTPAQPAERPAAQSRADDEEFTPQSWAIAWDV